MRLKSFTPIKFEDNAVVIIDQTRLPNYEVWIRCETVADVADAIVTMKLRGAPLIGIAAAYAVAMAARSGSLATEADYLSSMRKVHNQLAATRPTAVNLFWALTRMSQKVTETALHDGHQRYEILLAEARAIHDEDLRLCLAIGEAGAALLSDGDTVMTHCNAGALATGGHGTALGVIRSAVAQGKRIRVLARETRPLLQGGRLTAWELAQDGIDVTVIPDSAGAWLMSTGKVDRVVTGADRIAHNGDSANKIGTYDLAIVAAHHGVPFHVAAPYSTIDLACPDAAAIRIEERPATEVTHIGDSALVPSGVAVRNPAFDVTPAALITSIITDVGIILPPYGVNLEAGLSRGLGHR